MIPDINLLPPINRRHSDFKLMIVLLFIAVIFVLGFIITQHFSTSRQITLLEKEQQHLQAEQEQLQLKLDSLRSNNVGSLQQSLQFLEAISYPVSPLLEETRDLLPQGSYLREYKFGFNNLTLVADFNSMFAISQYVEHLENSKYFTDVRPGLIEGFVISSAEHAEQLLTSSRISRYKLSIEMYIDQGYLDAGGAK